MDIIDKKNCPVCGTPVKIVSDGLTNRYEPVHETKDDTEQNRLREIIEWAVSKNAMDQSKRLPKGCSPMTGPERITAEICVENLQTAIRRRLMKEEP